MKKILLSIVAILFLLIGCSESGSHFKDAEWGMTVEQVIQVEQENGNKLYEEEADDEEISIEFEDLTIDGYLADVEFIFRNVVEKQLILVPSLYDKKFEKLDKKLKDDSLSDEEREKIITDFEEDNKDLIEEIENIPDEIQLNDFRLVEGEYYFSDIDEEGEAEIFDTLESKYGKPYYGETPYNSDELYVWITDSTHIMFSGSFVTYSAVYQSLEEYMKINNQNNKDGDL